MCGVIAPRLEPCFPRLLGIAAQCARIAHNVRRGLEARYRQGLPHIAAAPTMTGEETFRIRPGRVRSRGGQRALPAIAQALAAAQRAGGHISRQGRIIAPGRSTFGRGRSASVRATHRLGHRSRQVIVKTRVVRHGGRASLAAHLNYLQRDGVTRDGERGVLFGAEADNLDRNDFAALCKDDRHHFRFIVSPEDAADMGDLKGFARELMSRMETDLGSRLDWRAVAHWNTGIAFVLGRFGEDTAEGPILLLIQPTLPHRIFWLADTMRGVGLDDAKLVPRIGEDAAQQPYRAARGAQATPDDRLAAQLLRLLAHSRLAAHDVFHHRRHVGLGDLSNALGAEERNDMARDPAKIGDLGASLLGPAALAENPTSFQLRHIQLAQLLDRDRLAGTVPIFEWVVALATSASAWIASVRACSAVTVPWRPSFILRRTLLALR